MNNQNEIDKQQVEAELHKVSENLHGAATFLKDFHEQKPRNLQDLSAIWSFFQLNLEDHKVKDCLTQVQQILNWLKSAEKDSLYNRNNQLTNAPLIISLKSSLENQVITRALANQNKFN